MAETENQIVIALLSDKSVMAPVALLNLAPSDGSNSTLPYTAPVGSAVQI
jgi:hypothetical protein